VASYPGCGCPSGPTRTDSGESVVDTSKILVACVSSGPMRSCETYVTMRPARPEVAGCACRHQRSVEILHGFQAECPHELQQCDRAEPSLERYAAKAKEPRCGGQDDRRKEEQPEPRDLAEGLSESRHEQEGCRRRDGQDGRWMLPWSRSAVND